jgi:hypothetical protein
MAETKEDVVKRRWLAIQEELNPGETDLSRTLENIAVVRAGWHRVRNEAGEWAYFPSGPVHPSGSKEARAAEDAWEVRALEMHSAQEPVILAPKPRENVLSRIERGD